MTYRHVLAALGSAFVLAVCFACTISEDGERASTGDCPEERCSDAVTGLTFYTIALGANETSDVLLPVAVGGTTTIAAVPVDGYIPADAQYLTDGPAISVDGPGTYELFDEEDSIDVRAHAEGDTLLRVVDPDDALLDRVNLATRAIATLDVVVDGRDGEDTYLRAGQTDALVVRLFDAEGNRLLDGSMIAEGDGVERVYWDYYDVTAPEDATEIQLSIQAGDGTWDVTVPVR